MWKNYLLIVLLLTGCMYLRPKQNGMSNLSQTEWAKALTKQPEAVILDVRTEEEFESKFPGKTLMPQVTKDGEYIGNGKETVAYLKENRVL